MVKTRLGLFSGVFLMVVGTVHSWPQPAAAKAPSRSGSCLPDTCDPKNPLNGCDFRGFDNIPLGGAGIFLVDCNLLVDLTPMVSNRSTAMATDCAPPTNTGTKVEFNDSDAKKAGDKGFTIDKEVTIGNPDHDPEPDATSYYVQLDEYWGISCTEPEWVTEPMPIGFKFSTDNNGIIKACADFHEDPIRCFTVQVEFKSGDSEGMIECDPGTVFTVPAFVGDPPDDDSDDPLMELMRVKTHALCPGQSSCTNECVARQKAALEFVFKNQVSITENTAACTVTEGTSPFSARKIIFKPKMDVDADCDETCGSSCPDDRAIDGPLSRGGTTPPIRTMSFFLADESRASNRAPTPGTFIITNEAIGIPTVGTWSLVVMVQLVLVAGTVVIRRRLPMIRAFGHGC